MAQENSIQCFTEWGAQSWKQHSPGHLDGSACRSVFGLPTSVASKGQWMMLPLGFWKEPHHSSPRALAEPHCLAKRQCTSLSTCQALRLLYVLRNGQNKSVVAASTSQKTGDEVMPVPASTVSSMLSDYIIAGVLLLWLMDLLIHPWVRARKDRHTLPSHPFNTPG